MGLSSIIIKAMSAVRRTGIHRIATRTLKNIMFRESSEDLDALKSSSVQLAPGHHSTQRFGLVS